MPKGVEVQVLSSAPHLTNIFSLQRFHDLYSRTLCFFVDAVTCPEEAPFSNYTLTGARHAKEP
jgi:hypothetical protein